jgi:hypothetical protein
MGTPFLGLQPSESAQRRLEHRFGADSCLWAWRYSPQVSQPHCVHHLDCAGVRQTRTYRADGCPCSWLAARKLSARRHPDVGDRSSSWMPAHHRGAWRICSGAAPYGRFSEGFRQLFLASKPVSASWADAPPNLVAGFLPASSRAQMLLKPVVSLKPGWHRRLRPASSLTSGDAQ